MVRPIGILMSSRALLIGSLTLVALAMVILTGATVWSQHVNRSYTARADMAYRQALQVVRLEAATLSAQSVEGQGRQTLSRMAAAYLATIHEEDGLLGGEGPHAPHQSEERRSALRLIEAIAANGRSVPDITVVRALAGAIAKRELREAMQARNDAEAVARQTRIIVIAVAVGLLLLSLGLIVVFQRQLVVPLRKLGAGTQDLTQARQRDRLVPQGLSEIRTLITHFNDMANAVEARVAERTSSLQRANADLAAVDRRRRLFLAKVSHELRSPVTAIRGEAEVSLRHCRSPDDMREALMHIEQNTLFLQRRLDDLLNLARAEDARLPMVTTRVDPFALVHKTCDVVMAYAKISNVEIDARAVPDAVAEGGFVSGDADRLQQALIAVIDNAIKFSPPDGTITLAAAMGDGAAVLTISDEGPGVDEADLAQIFDPYVQSHTGRSLGGTGLGLSLARWIIAAHDGTISARNVRRGSDGAEGLCVTMQLPIVG